MQQITDAEAHILQKLFLFQAPREKVSRKPWDASEVSLNSHQVLKQGRAYSIGMERRQSIMHITGSISIPTHSWREAHAQCLTKGTGQD